MQVQLSPDLYWFPFHLDTRWDTKKLDRANIGLCTVVVCNLPHTILNLQLAFVCVVTERVMINKLSVSVPHK
jgi:hypothetical protein